MENQMPTKISRLFSKAEDNAAGCHSHEVAINLKQNKEADVLADLAPARTAELSYQESKGTKLAATKARQTADKNGRAFIKAARQLLEKHLGPIWSQMWAAAGFVNGSFKIPRVLSERIALIKSLSDYFAAHPGYEADQIGITGSAAEDLHTALHSTNATCNACLVDVGTKKATRNTAVKKLRKRMSGLSKELRQLLPPDDPRWNGFGLNMPAAVGLPDVPEGLVVTAGGPGHLLAKWDSSRLGERYRVYRKIVGVDNDWVLVKTTTETESDLNTFTSGQVVRVRVAASNDTGDSGLFPFCFCRRMI